MGGGERMDDQEHEVMEYRRRYGGVSDVTRDVIDARETRIVDAIDAELAALIRHAGDVANSSEGGAPETEWANGVDYAVNAIRRALDSAVRS